MKKKQFAKILDGMGKVVADTKFATSYEVDIEGVMYTIQLIHRREYRDIAELFLDFDFEVCRFAYGGALITFTPEAQNDLRERRLTISGRLTSGNLLGRVVKYIKYGYMPGPGVMERIISVLGVHYRGGPTPDGYQWPDM